MKCGKRDGTDDKWNEEKYYSGGGLHKSCPSISSYYTLDVALTVLFTFLPLILYGASMTAHIFIVLLQETLMPHVFIYTRYYVKTETKTSRWQLVNGKGCVSRKVRDG